MYLLTYRPPAADQARWRTIRVEAGAATTFMSAESKAIFRSKGRVKGSFRNMMGKLGNAADAISEQNFTRIQACGLLPRMRSKLD